MEIVEFLGDQYAIKDGHILEPLGNYVPDTFNIPNYDLTVPKDKISEINLPKPIGKYFGMSF